MKRWMVVAVLTAGVVIMAAGCATTGQGSKTYTTGQAQRAQSVEYGTVLAVADVTIQAEPTGAGGVGGAVVGGILGHAISGRSGPTTQRLGTTVGALGGAAAGSAAEKAMGTKEGVEIEVQLDDGRIFVVVQEKDDQYAVGDSVRVITSGDGTMRVRQ